MSLHYLIDGFNVLYALDEMPQGSWEAKREALIAYLRSAQLQGRNRLTIVFDSRQGSGDQWTEGDASVVYTAGESADDWISRHVRQSSNPRVLVVVTNDQGLRQLLRGTGAKVVSATDFLRGKDRPTVSHNARTSSEEYRFITEELRKMWLK